MIVSHLSHDNRKQRRAKKARARKAGIKLDITRITSLEVAAHIVRLTEYLNNPSPQTLRELFKTEEKGHHVLEYIGKAKEGTTSDADLADAMDEAKRERVVQVLTRNLLCSDLPDIQLELALVAGLSPGGEDPIEHIVLSWQEGEEPTPEQMEEALDTLLEVMGTARHQAYAVVHGDTDNRHMHIAVNRVDPATGARVQIGLGIERPLETLHQAIAIIEHKQGWMPQENALYSADDGGCFDRSTGILVRDARMQPCSTAAQHARIREQRARDKEERKISSSARDFERRTGMESLQRRVLATAAPAIREARSWDDVHRALAPAGMRYLPLTSGAVIECGDRTIAASTAWGGASADKMITRLGPYAPPPDGLAVAAFEDRIIAAMYKVAEKRREAQAARKARQTLRTSVAAADASVTLGYRDRVEAEMDAAPENLNAIRQRASNDLNDLRIALERLRRRRSRRRGRPDDQEAEIGDEDAGDEEPVRAILIGPRAQHLPPVPDPDLVRAGYRADREDRWVAYRRGSTLCFVDHGDRIDVHRDDDRSIRDGLLLAQRNWGKVHACGDKVFLDRLVRIAVEEGVEITNHELQPLLEAARRERPVEQPSVLPDLAPKALQIATARHLHKPDILRGYSPAFGEWIDFANTTEGRGRVDARANAIAADPELARQLAELESQQFSFARELRKAAARECKRRLADLERYTDEPVPWARDGLPCLPERPSEEELASRGVLLAPAVDPVSVAEPVEVGPATASPQPAHAAPSLKLRVADIDDQYLPIALARRQQRIAELEDAVASALRDRVGPADNPPRHIARLILSQATIPQPESSHRAAPMDRHKQEFAALSRDSVFRRLVADASTGDKGTLNRLRVLADGPGDVLGRVPLASNGRLNFGYRSREGHDPGARPPLEWWNLAVGRVDFTRMRLTKHNGLIGVTDEDLLEATHHNLVAILYPDVQVHLEVEWRVQRERDAALLWKINAGQVAANVSLTGNSRDFGARAEAVKGASAEEKVHLNAMLRDPEGYRAVRKALRDSPTAARPLLRHPEAAVRALLRAAEEMASAPVMAELRSRIVTMGDGMVQASADPLTAKSLLALLRRPSAAPPAETSSSHRRRRGRLPQYPGQNVGR